MITRTRILILCSIGFCLGLIFLALQNNIIIIRNPFIRQNMQERSDVEKRRTNLYYWHHDKWNHEPTEIIWYEDKSKTIKHLIDSWLTLMDEEKLMDKKTS